MKANPSTIWEKQNGEIYMVKKITKKRLDELMKEYDWDKNTITNTIMFLDYMHGLYAEAYADSNKKLSNWR